MPDDRSRISQPDDTRRAPVEERDLAYWAKQLGVTREELSSALEDAGAMVKEQPSGSR
jgi:Protein of unknown function (DUF3606)